MCLFEGELSWWTREVILGIKAFECENPTNTRKLKTFGYVIPVEIFSAF